MLGDAGTIDGFDLAFQYQIKRIIKDNGYKTIANYKDYISAYRLRPVPYGNICCTYHQLKYSSLAQKANQEPHSRAYLLEKGGLGKNKSGAWAESRKG